ncbi:clathrin heavy chain linker domain-containing protein 1 isoform X2 [Eublepharis macularius]|uniref:Clathrin heavy chain linker domain-containing protein 1 n=1 Tax=Eublepharis macularius TaxID=481883 RepID=A0AA97JRE6_EUBMA|nr:clathrin heavy chain linker domain-containing protein 1 isoform X2 [Eublepharis macularius]
MSTASIGMNKHSVLPPIIPESEKEFLDSIHGYIISEIENVGCTKEGPAEEYYVIYRNVFERIIEHVKAYKNILTTIKQEYDAFIEAVKKGQRTAFYLHGKLKVLACESTTLMYYRKRITQLEQNIKKIERNSTRTENLIKKIRTFRTTAAVETTTPCKKLDPSKAIPGSLVSSGSSIFERDHTQATEAADMIEYIERFNELFSRGQYESAAIFAANCPRGILRNEETMEKFKAVSSVKGKILPLLMYCEALVSTSMAVKHPLPANLTVEAIKCALSEKRLELVMYWITQQKLSFNEEAGDVICAYGEVDKHNRSQCLALAQIAYSRCGAHKKAALCLCKQGQISGAMDYIHQLQYFSTDDYIYLVKNCPSVQLIRCLTQEWKGKPAALSLGATVLFLYNTEQRIYSIRLLEDIAKESRNILEQMIINDSNCNVEEWKEIAEICFQHKKIKLGKLLISILTAQDGVLELPPDDDSAKLMEHVFM